MEKGQIIECYRLLRKCKWSGLQPSTRYDLLDDMAVMRQVVEPYDKDISEASEKLKTEELDMLLRKIDDVNRGKAKMTGDEVQRANVLYSSYSRELERYRNGLLGTAQELDLKKVSREEIDRLVDKNELTGYDMECLKILMQ